MSTTETSFGARLRRAEQVINAIRTMPGYSAPQPEVQLAGLETLVQQATTHSHDLRVSLEAYHHAVATRRQHFKTIETSLTRIRAAIIANYGKSSREASRIATHIRAYRSETLTQPPAITETSPDSTTTATTTRHSSSQRSFGARTQHYADLITALGEFTGYVPPSPDFSLSTLTAHLQAIRTANAQVDLTFAQLLQARSTRRSQYTTLRENINRAIRNVQAIFGPQSPEFAAVRSLNL